MKLGLLTACLPHWDLDRIAGFAAEAGYERLEVAAWPSVGSRPHEAAHLPTETFTDEDAAQVHATLDRHGLEISALAYYDNNLTGDLDARARYHEHLRRVVLAAERLGVPYVGTFLGRDIGRSVLENIAEAERVFPSLVEFAGEHHVQLMVENCPMEGWHPDGYPANIAYSPELWEWMCRGLGLKLNWDPSHLVWLGIDPVETIAPFAEHIVHAQAKDVEVFPGERNRYGVFGTVLGKNGNPWKTGWWRYRVPGRGSVDWLHVIDRLYESGFTGTLSVEHEDPVWGGEDDRILEGLRIAQSTLRPLIAQESRSVDARS